MYRITKLKHTCLHEFAESYLTYGIHTRQKSKMKFLKKHPNFTTRCISKREHKVIPTILYYTFPDSRNFGCYSIQNKLSRVNDLDKNDIRYKSMEEYAKACCILFCPFRSIKDIKDGSGSHLSFLYCTLKSNKIEKGHLSIFKNDQDYHNAMFCGSPTDILEQTTNRPKKDRNKKKKDHNETTVAEEVIMLSNEHFRNIETLDPEK